MRVLLAAALNRVMGFTGLQEGTRVQAHKYESLFPDPLKGSMDPCRMNFGAVLGSLLKHPFAVVQTFYPGWGSK